MKNKLQFLVLLLWAIYGSGQASEFREYSYTEFFQLIEQEEDSIFTLSHAAIVFDSLTDKRFASEVWGLDNNYNYLKEDTIRVDKQLRLEEVVFVRDPRYRYRYFEMLHHIVFEKEVRLKNVLGYLDHCTLKGYLRLEYDDGINDLYQDWIGTRLRMVMAISNNTFYDGMGIRHTSEHPDESLPIQIGVENNEVHPDSKYNTMMSIYGGNFFNTFIEDNRFIGQGEVNITASSGRKFEILGNVFRSARTSFSLNNESAISDLSFKNNHFERWVELDVNRLLHDNEIDWGQFSYGVVSSNGLRSYLYENIKQAQSPEEYDEIYDNQELRDTYYEVQRIRDIDAFKSEMILLGSLYNLYKSQHDTDFSNGVYIELKDLETKRMEYLFSGNPTFDTFFQWKVNQFLKVFSAYGTRPSLAIVMSLYVILGFSLIY